MTDQNQTTIPIQAARDEIDRILSLEEPQPMRLTISPPAPNIFDYDFLSMPIETLVRPRYRWPDPPKAKPSKHKRAKVKAQRKQAQVTRRNCK